MNGTTGAIVEAVGDAITAAEEANDATIETVAAATGEAEAAAAAASEAEQAAANAGAAAAVITAVAAGEAAAAEQEAAAEVAAIEAEVDSWRATHEQRLAALETAMVEMAASLSLILAKLSPAAAPEETEETADPNLSDPATAAAGPATDASQAVGPARRMRRWI